MPSRNFNREIFTRRPEFCLLHEKLQKTCSGWKRGPLTEKYPELCASLEAVKEELSICQNVSQETNSDDNHQLDPVFLQLNGPLLKLRDEMYLYARDNLAVVNIYIKDAVVTKIRRDQKVRNFFLLYWYTYSFFYDIGSSPENMKSNLYKALLFTCICLFGGYTPPVCTQNMIW